MRHILLAGGIFLIVLSPIGTNGDETTRDGDWLVRIEEPHGKRILTMELTLTPRAEPKPALKHRLLPDPFRMHNGNAALFYLKAMGFFEQDAVRDRVREFQRQAAETAIRPDGSRGTPDPYRWLDLPLEDLPIDEAKQYLRLLSFQEPLLTEAANRKRFELDRDIRNVENPYDYLLPEIQSMRELGRMQSLRFRVAVREGRTEDAIRIAGEQLSMARHLGQDEFLVSNLVGMAIARMAWDDWPLIYRLADPPNLYWALAAIPPAFTLSQESLSLESNNLFLAVKPLGSVDQQSKTPGYWDELARESLIALSSLDHDGPTFSDDPGLQGVAMAAAFAAAYPDAKRFLMEQAGLTRPQVESLDEVQTVLLASRRHFEIASDETFKWAHLPHWQRTNNEAFAASTRFRNDHDGWFTLPTNLLLPAVRSALDYGATVDAGLAMMRTVEAIRDHAAHGGGLPMTLDELRLPAPIDPFTGYPPRYEHRGDHAMVSIVPWPSQEYRLVLRLANPGDE